MANKLQVQIQETVEELEHRLERSATAVNKEKLLVLYWLATKKIQKRAELATMLKRDESTIYRWLRAYFQGGITELLSIKKAPGKTPHIPPERERKINRKAARTTGRNKLWQIIALARKRMRNKSEL
ncbi:helix-turn-helix domain-containing protein [Microcoleus asticus]|uniref:Transposase n=1 Tax=Microcoleus asticus IPMA8 TaxID=2563858 RepID=A0ABX2D4M2_9CYAN|nr:helix-turn-helix domain-containing protein [Microcoleus asticus]NQE37113.1 hypothetical protein [Microcoleus asticus IPMA8]